jgi:PhzF family phenazine biosynthesis protein
MGAHPFRQVDVFTTEPYRGNPVAVVLAGGDELSTEEMLRIARWTNLSETTFVLEPTDPGADYRVRIFTPVLELPFAGHPTLGTCRAWLEHGGTPRSNGVVVQECGAGLVRVRDDGERLAFAAPPIARYEPAEEDTVAQIAGALGIARDEIVAAQWVDNGPGWVAALLRDADAVLALHPGHTELDIGVAGPHPDRAECAFEVRAWFPKDGTLVEDPVTGSLNASLAQWLLDSGRASVPYVAAQGTAMGRAGRVHIDRDADGTIWVGGGTVTCVEGTITLQV